LLFYIKEEFVLIEDMSNNRSYGPGGRFDSSESSYRSKSSHGQSRSSVASRQSHNERTKYAENKRDFRSYKNQNDENYDMNLINNKSKTCSDKIEIKTDPIAWSSRQTSPLKRRNNDAASPATTESSPQKRLRETTQTARGLAQRFNLSSFTSPKKGARSSSLCTIKKENKYASTPKSERRVEYRKKIREMLDQNSVSMQRNMSNNWADIVEELDEQAKEVEIYIQKVTAKYGIEAETLRKSIETNAETLRKRQKCINFGKVTAEYQNYVMELPRKKRQPFHPRTPNKFRKCSRRKFDGLIKKWRRLLHAYDENPEQLTSMKHSIDTNDSNEYDMTDDFGGASNVGSGISGYNIDDFDILDDSDDPEANKLVAKPIDQI